MPPTLDESQIPVSRKLKIGAAQFASAIAEIDANVETHLGWIEQGRSAGLDLMVMPEVSLTGHYGAEAC